MSQIIAVNGSKLRELRKKHGFRSVSKFAKAIGLKDGQYLYKIERNEANPSLGLLNRMAQVLGVLPSELLTESSGDLFQNAEIILQYAECTSGADDSVRGRIKQWLQENPHKLEILKKLLTVNNELNELVLDAYSIFANGTNLDEKNTMITFQSNDDAKEPISVALPQQSIKSVILLLIAGYVVRT